jgi:hypothetical protein
LNSWTFSDNSLTAWGDVTLAPTGQMNDIRMVGNSFLVPVSITGAGNSVIDLAGNTYGSSLALAGSFATAAVGGIVQGGGPVTNTATGSVALNLPGPNQLSLASCNTGFGLQIAGSSTGITYSFPPVCQWQLQGNVATVTFNLALTNKGAGTGAVTIVGLPLTVQAGGNGGTVAHNANMAGLTASVVLEPASGAKALNVYQQAATGLIVLTNTNLTNTSIIQGTVSYMVAVVP